MNNEQAIKSAQPDYEKGFYEYLSECIQLREENERLKKALLNLALVIGEKDSK